MANPINRYLINWPMLPQLKRDADGGLTLLIQNESPGKDMEANWLPGPKGPFAMYVRLYWPKAEALDGKWKAPPLKREKSNPTNPPSKGQKHERQRTMKPMKQFTMVVLRGCPGPC